MHISVITPVYKAEKCLNELYSRLKLALEGITSDFEIIMIEDGGIDNSWNIILALAEKDPRVKGLKFSRNFGQHYGITAGLDYCNGDWVVIMDCDLQDRPEEIQRLYKKAYEGYDVVLASRNRRKDPSYKKFFSWLFYKIFVYLSGIQYNGQVSNFCILSKKVVHQYRLFHEKFRFFGALISWMGFPTATIEVQHDKRFEGKSAYSFLKLFRLAINTIVAYSDKPLKLAIKLGFTIALLAFACGIYIFADFIFYGSIVTGWSSLIISLYFMGGLIIAILGIIGIYLGKTFEETKKRPLYVIQESTTSHYSTLP